MFVATVPDKIHGAGVIAYPNFMEDTAQKMGGDFFVLPSNIHEVLLVKDNGQMIAKELENMVKEVNATQVEPADHVYHYNSQNHIFELTDKYEERQREAEYDAVDKDSVLGDLKEKKQEIAKKDPARFNKALFIQDRNPGVPGVMYKVAPETEEKRKSLKNARELWIATVDVTGKPLYEIYTGNELSVNEFDLDHFVPRSYVSNDELWNLTPMAKQLNSSKNNKLPERRYIKDFVEYNYYLYSLIFANNNKDQAAILKHYFDRCENQHLNAIWAAEKLYIPGNTKEQFGNILEENLSLVYDSAKLQEYEECK